MNQERIIRMQDPATVSLGDYAWRSGARTFAEAQSNLNTELEEMRKRYALAAEALVSISSRQIC